ncbi:MAG: hypothetical protein K5657_06190 [Desulfovibrio sp.]|nr:hypothetical protein [Desulfovibrio sp.]
MACQSGHFAFIGSVHADFPCPPKDTVDRPRTSAKQIDDQREAPHNWKICVYKKFHVLQLNGIEQTVRTIKAHRFPNFFLLTAL